jgi:lysophospholipase L1-like esterase
MTKENLPLVKNKILAFGFTAVLVAVFGCSGTISSFTSQSSLNGSSQSSNPDTTMRGFPKEVPFIAARVYHAYGASITAGYLLSDPSTQAYPAVVAKDEQVPLSNFAISGAQACDLSPTEIFKHLDSPSLASHLAYTYTLQVGTNDVDRRGTGAYESVYMQCHQAAIAWLALPLEYKVLANSSGMQTSGPGKLDTSSPWSAWITSGNGASESFTIKTTHDGPIYAWPILDDGNTATYNYSLDGVLIGSASVQPSPLMVTSFATSRSLGFLRFPSVAAGTHTVSFTQTSDGANGVSVAAIATVSGSAADTLPTVLVGNLTYQLQGNYGYACDITDDPCLQYNKDIQTDINLLAGDGLKVRFFDTREYLKGTAAEMVDPLHPNAFGQQEIAKAIEEVW